jgi:hypothetical protein
MGLTNYPGGLASFGVPVLPNGIPFGPTSKTFFVAPNSGGDGNRGTDIKRPLDTLSKAQTLATADSNDVVYLISQSNTAANTTDYQSSALAWAKDGVHLIGVNSGNVLASRSRIAQLSTATNVDDLFTVSADNCLIANIHVFHGVDDATSKGAVLVSGQRNHFVNCHFAGIGHDTMDTADNYSLKVTGSENLFENCIIGLDTIARGTAATYEVIFSGAATRNVFRNCVFTTFAEDAAFVFVSIGSGGIDRYVLFDNCIFMNATNSTATTMTAGLTVNASAGGHVIVKDGMLIGATDWTAADSTVVQLMCHQWDTTNDVNIGIAATVDVA